MALPLGMIEDGLTALAKSQKIGAHVAVSHHQMHHMGEEQLAEHVRIKQMQYLTRPLVDMSMQYEVMEFSEHSMNGEMSTGFQAEAVVMHPADYQYLCKLLRQLKIDHQIGSLTIEK
jgi:hypothetical protein